MLSNNTLNPLSRLYPNLVIRKVEAPSIRSLSQERREISIERPKPTPKPEPKPEPKVSREPTPPRPVEVIVEKEPEPRPKREKKVKIVEQPIEKIAEPEPTPVPEPKKARPNRATGRVRDMLKGGPSQRESVAPQDGERGFQQKYSIEQRQAQYLERLSRKSVKNAEKEVSQVLEVLEKVNHDPVKLKEEERAVKKRLSLINTAKYFAVTNINNNEISNKASSSLPTPQPSDSGKSVTTDTVSNDGQPSKSIGRSRRRVRDEGSSSDSGSDESYDSVTTEE